MSHSKIAEWTYQLGIISTVAAVAYRLLWFGDLGHRLYGAIHVLPYNLLQLSVLAFLISIASNARCIATQSRTETKPSAPGKAA
jgi:hypothetical protein